MSALQQEGERPRNCRVRVAVRDGEIVRVKICRTCGEEKRVSDDQRSGFSANTRRPDGSVRGWKPECKTCKAADARARRAADVDATRAAHRAAYARLVADPERLAFRREQERRWRAEKRRTDPEFRRAEARRGQAWRQRKQAEDPEYFTPKRRAMRMESPSPRRALRTAPRIPSEWFRRWLTAYRAACEDPSDAQLADMLGMTERRVRSVLDGEYAKVELDVVDAALMNSTLVVAVDGREVILLGDLYPPEPEQAA